MLRFLRLSFLIICLTSGFRALRAQEPGTVVDVKLSYNRKPISYDSLSQFSFKVSEYAYGVVVDAHNVSDEKDSTQFHFFEWKPYRGEIYQVNIVHGIDTMIVRFAYVIPKKDPDDPNEMWNAFFVLDIPFQKGYYEVMDFGRDGSHLTYSAKQMLAPSVRKLDGNIRSVRN